MDDLQEAYEERAAILEYEGGMTKEDAEYFARRMVYGDTAEIPKHQD